jgi:MFS family permease
LLNLAVLRAPGLVAGLAVAGVLMMTYGGGFLFTLALHLQAGLGDSALRAGLSFTPCALAFGVCGYFWRRLPGRVHHLLAPLGCLAAAAGYLAVALVLHSGAQGGLMLPAALIVTGAALALGFSPLVTQSLVRVPPRHAADASGLLTTMIQLGQALGVAAFGSLFLTLDAEHGAAGPAVSGHALAITLGWLAATMVLGAAAGIPLARTVAAARRPAAAGSRRTHTTQTRQQPPGRHAPRVPAPARQVGGSPRCTAGPAPADRTAVPPILVARAAAPTDPDDKQDADEDYRAPPAHAGGQPPWRIRQPPDRKDDFSQQRCDF